MLPTAHVLNTNIQRVALIAEDDPDQSDMLRDALQDEGFTVETAFSGDVAYDKLLNHKYDLVILDIRMPGLSGSTVLKALRLKKTKEELPVLVMSAFATEADMTRYHEAGANAALAKPYEINELLKVIERLVPKGAAS
jgi:DNA-binding response OmpR family regulator